MEIARKMAGYSLGGADLLRRAMGKKIQAEMDAQKPLFLEGRGGERRRPRPRPTRSGTCSTSSPTTASTRSPRRRLRGGQLPDGVAEGQPPGRVHGRGDELRHPPHRQARRPTSRRSTGSASRWCRRASTARSATFAVEDGRIVYALGALKNVGVEAMRLITEARAAGGAFDRALRFRRAASTCAGSASGRWRCWRGPGRSDCARLRTAARSSRASRR